jgi:hypothetical protein
MGEGSHYLVEVHLDLQASAGPGTRAQRGPVRNRDRLDDGQTEPVPAVAAVTVTAHPVGAELLERLEQPADFRCVPLADPPRLRCPGGRLSQDPPASSPVQFAW